MIRLDILTKKDPTNVGDTYESWCASYVDTLGAPITEYMMNNRRLNRNSKDVLYSEEVVARQCFEGWGEGTSGLGATVAVYSRKEKWKRV